MAQYTQNLQDSQQQPRQPATILRFREVTARVGMGRTGIYQAIKDGVFPKQRQLGIKSVGWLESEIETWINTRNPVEPQ